MRQLIVLTLLTLTLFSCSNDDDSNNVNQDLSELFPCQPNNGNPENIYPCDLTLDTQNDINLFSQGGFTEIEGTLNIQGSNIENLNGLSILTRVRNLNIVNNPSLNDVSGLSNVETYNLRINNNSSLTNLSGICRVVNLNDNTTSSINIKDNENLVNLIGMQELPLRLNFVVENNSSLTSLHGIESTSTINVGQWRIKNNSSLTSLQGLENLNSIRWLEILDNYNLNDIKLNSLSYVSERLQIGWNNNLVQLNTLNNLNSLGSLIINDNNSLTNIDNFSSISSINEIVIQSNSDLQDFCVIMNLYNSGIISDGDWTIYDNGFTPDIINGICQP